MATVFSAILRIGNLFLSSANVIVAFSLLAYILSHNWRSPVARAYAALLSFVLIVYAGDIILANVDALASAETWLRLQWLGIAFVPAAYLHLSDGLLCTTGAYSRWRRAMVIGGYLLGTLSFLLAVFSKVIVRDAAQLGPIFHLRSGPLFWAFACYYFAATLGGLLNIQRARARCLTTTSRRRMGYLALAFAAPGLGVFPFLLSATMSRSLSVTAIMALSLIGNVAVVLMTIVMGYIMAYEGVLLPDRVIKHSLIHYLMRGPLVAAAMVVLVLVMPSVERILGIKRDTVLIFAIVVTSVLLQVVIILAKPAIDRLIYRRDRAEINWIQEMDKRLLTSHDLEQILHNVLTATCDLLRARTGFVVTVHGQGLQLRAWCGSREQVSSFLRVASAAQLVAWVDSIRTEPRLAADDIVVREPFVLLPLRAPSTNTILGVLGIERWWQEDAPAPSHLAALDSLVRRGGMALDDMRLQQEVFAALRRLEPEIAQLQRWGSTPRYIQSGAREPLIDSPIASPSFVAMVRDALSHYWGGPKLSKSPLHSLTVVRMALAGNDAVPAKALRAVLRQAIERLRPASEPSLTDSEWVVYNILELRFLRGERIRDVASRLAMSESDLYRKQRIAVDELAKTLAAMEQEARDRAALT
ncbi:MAG: histidine kinase N-terminal 7TM domain-containing protein [Anaerolineae bacterium]